MLNVVASFPFFIATLGLFACGALGALAFRKNDKLANALGSAFAVAGSACGMIFAGAVMMAGSDIDAQAIVSSFSQFSLALHIDRLAAFFIFVICLIAFFCSIYGIDYVRSYYRRRSIGALGFFYNSFIVGMLLVVTASNGVLFLVAWEVMSLASYFLVTYDNDAKNIKAGYVYLAMTHIGAACLMVAFALLFAQTGSFDFAAIKAAAATISPVVRDAVIGLLLVGLGVKAGVIPMHIWLPSAHPAAPSHVSALMSGVMIKTGIYMMIRMCVDILQPIPGWWGVVILIAGAISAVLGVLYALTEHDIKRLLAYHSIENIGIILLGLGASLIFSANGQDGLAIAALVAALFHTLNHAVFKSLLFLSAGSVIHATHTRNIEKYGGLIKLMPITALCFLIGSMAISALPPFNGFFSEWITYQSLFNGIWSSGQPTVWAFVFAIVALAITGGLALACFVKAFGVTFLARARSESAEKAVESSRWMQAGMIGVAAMCVLIGLAAAPVTDTARAVAQQTTGIDGVSTVATAGQSVVFYGHEASVNGPVTAGLILLAGFTVWLVVRYGVYRKQKVSYGPTWDCGTPLNGRMEITATGFARSIILIFRGILRPSLQSDIEYDDSANRYTFKSHRVSIDVRDIFRIYLYAPVRQAFLAVSRWVKTVQNGNLNAYILYIFAALVIVLVVGAL